MLPRVGVVLSVIASGFWLNSGDSGTLLGDFRLHAVLARGRYCSLSVRTCFSPGVSLAVPDELFWWVGP